MSRGGTCEATSGVSRRVWPPEVKARALAIYAEEGGPAASEATGVPCGTIWNWVHREIARVPAVLVAADDPARRNLRPWREHRDAFCAALMEAVSETLVQTRVAVAEGRLRDARDGWVGVGIGVDKLQLLSGEATARSEQYRWTAEHNVEAIQAEIVELERELGM